MIYEIFKEIAAELTAKGVPYPILYGPNQQPNKERTIPSWPRYEMERDRDGTDRLAAPTSRPLSPKMVGVRWQACSVKVMAKSSLGGAAIHDHERECDHMVDAFLVALHKTVRIRKNQYSVTQAKFMSASEMLQEGIETWAGVAYRIKFEIDRGIVDTKWDGASLAKVTGIGLGATVTITGDPSSATDQYLPDAETRLSE